jgi:phage terminase large subunit
MPRVIAASTSLDAERRELSRIESEFTRRRLAEHVDLPAVFHPLLQPARYKGAWGGRGSGKSHAFAEILVDRCNTRETRAVCVREHQVSLDHSVKQLLEDKIDEFSLRSRFRVQTNHIETPFDGVILFQGMKNQTADSIKSLEGFDVAWFEEAQAASERSLTMLRPTIRTPGSELWFSWNPEQASDPVDQLLRGTVLPPGAVVVRANYRDNPHFPDVLRAEMEWDQARDPEKYAHIWLGEYQRNSEARVFKNWRVEEFTTPADAIHRFGGDWGYSVDPAVLVRCHLNPLNKRELRIDYEAYQVGCEIDHLPALFGTVPDAHLWPIRSDSARPECISYMQRHGYPKLRAATKGNHSVKEGIIFLQGFDIVIHPRCVHTVDEFTMYAYKVDQQTNLVTPYLSDKKNHVIDSVRYAAEELRKPKTWCSF